jgi:glutamate--cysteine ligase catalytic subunit
MNGLSITSMASAPILGTPNHILISDPLILQELEEHNNILVDVNHASKSKYILDSTLNPHPRFRGLMQSIRERRGKKIEIYAPIYPDTNTNLTVPTEDEPVPGQIYMDAMGFGMGCSCLQVTYEASSINHARYLHDAFLPFTGILSALSASAPIYKGKLANIDMRWTVIS